MNSKDQIVFKKRADSLPHYNIGILMGEISNSFWNEMKRQYQILAPKMGLEIEYFWPSPDMDEEAQLKRLMEMVESNFDVVIINPMSDHNLVRGIFHAVQHVIRVIDVGEKTNQELVKEAKPNYIPLKTVDFYYQGILGARYIIQRLRSFGHKKVAIIEGRREATQSIRRSQGAADTFKQDPSVKLVKREPADFDRLKAMNLAESILKEEPEIRAFFCANDVMALGVVEAVHRACGSGDIIVVGVDLIEEAVESIRRGLLNASVAFSTESVARVVLESTIKVLKGEKVPNEFMVESAVVNRDHLDFYLSSFK